MLTKSYMLINQCHAFEPHEPHVTLVEYEMYLRLFIFLIWIKKSGWVTDGANSDYYSYFPEDY
jgi:hypothetical protein